MNPQLAPEPQTDPAELLADRARHNLAERAEHADDLSRLGLLLGLFEEADGDEHPRLVTASPFVEAASDRHEQATPDPGRHIRRLYVA